MRKQFLLFIALLLSTNLISQSVDDLDAKYGFKHFKLKSSPVEYMEELEEIESWFSSQYQYMSTYKYKGNQISQVGGVDIGQIELTFYKDELQMISIDFGDSFKKEFTESEFDLLLYSLEKLYGQPYNIRKDSGGRDIKILEGRVWKGGKVNLELMRIQHDGALFAIGYISIVEKNVQQKMIEESF